MTQVEKLIAGMAAPAAEGSSFQKLDQSNLVMEQFESIMNQSSGNLPGKNLSFGKQNSDTTDRIFSLGGTTSVQKDYAKFSQGTRTITEAKQELSLIHI